MLQISRCPSCGSKKLTRVCRTWTGESQGKRYEVPKLEFYECPECREKIYDREAMQRIEAISPVFSGMKTPV